MFPFGQGLFDFICKYPHSKCQKYFRKHSTDDNQHENEEISITKSNIEVSIR